ncbi:THUMP domain-containing protein 2-like [Ostrea edulis]|uniref:THUMP domain-containing protein 2-like n=1 Tax=Ostrea edulis TaxID=37623 RepID=UPI0024AEAB07|nr:THUMP domain-containing protein 2-like [Ostrea edulis]
MKSYFESESKVMRFFCTAGRGTETFAYQEIYEEVDKEYVVSISEGRVHFQGSVNQIDTILELKTVERAFALVFYKGSNEYKDLDRATFLNCLRADILNEQVWRNDELCKVIELLQTRHGGKIQRELTCSRGEGPPAKKFKQEGQPSFRVSCKCSGMLGRKVSSQLLAKQIGIKLNQLLRWRVNYRDPDIEICIQVSDAHVSVGIPLTKIPLSKRNYVKCHGLRGPVTWIMMNLLEIKNQCVVLDPMCGKATILLEAAKNFEDVFCIGCDVSSDQLNLADENIRFGNVQARLQLIQADCRALPLRDECVDCIVCDTPFGKKHSVKGSSVVFHESFLQEMCRVLRSNGKVVLLVSEDIHQIYKNSEIPDSSDKHSVSDQVLNSISEGGEDRKDQYCVPGNKSANLHLDDPSNAVVLDIKKKCDNSFYQEELSTKSSIVPLVMEKSGVSYRKTENGGSFKTTDSGLVDCVDSNRNEQEVLGLQSVLQKFDVIRDHYIKLGETNSYIIVLKKR